MNCQMSRGDIGVSLIKFLVYYYMPCIQHVASLIYICYICTVFADINRNRKWIMGIGGEVYFFVSVERRSEGMSTICSIIIM